MLPEGNRRLKLGSNLYTGQGEEGIDLVSSFGSWGYETSTCNFGGPFIGSGRSPGEGNDNPLQHSCLENPMDGGA